MQKITAAFVGALMATTSAMAQDKPADIANNTQFGDWTVACQAVTVARNICRLIQEQKMRDTKTLVARLIAFPTDKGGAVLLAQVPMGVYLPGGAVFRLEGNDEETQQEMIWQRCMGDICEAALALDAEMLGKMTTAGAILFGYRGDIQSQPVITRVSMAKFTEGLDALRAPQ